MSKLASVLLLTLLATEALAGVPGEVAPGGHPVATIGGQVLTQEMLDVRLRQLTPDQLAQMKASGQYEEVVRSVALGELLYQEAIAHGFHEDPKAQLVLAVEARDILASEYVERLVDELVSESAVQARYAAASDMFRVDEVHARHILVEEREQADALLAELRGGADFAALAARASLDPGSGPEGGDLGWFDPSQMVEPFALAVRGAAVGLVAEPVQTSFGWHLIEVLDKRDVVPLDEVRAEIEEELRREAVETLLASKEAKLDLVWADPAHPGEPVAAADPAPAAKSESKPEKAKKPKR